MRTKEVDEVKANALTFLKKNLKPGSKVYTIVRHVSKSGMSRNISTFIARKGEIIGLDWYVAHVLDAKRDPSNGGIKVHGCGMDMGFDLVYRLGRRLYPNGFKLAKNQYGRNGDKSGFDRDGGYSLKQEWL